MWQSLDREGRCQEAREANITLAYQGVCSWQDRLARIVSFASAEKVTEMMYDIIFPVMQDVLSAFHLQGIEGVIEENSTPPRLILKVGCLRTRFQGDFCLRNASGSIA